MSPALDIAFGVVGVIIVFFAARGLDRSTEKLAAYYGIPDAVTGAVLLAVGSSFPELTTAVIAPLLHGSFELGVSAIVGSALFNILVIPGMAGALRRHALPSSRDIVYKESLFYLLAISVLTMSFALAVVYAPGEEPLTGSFTRPAALIPLALYGLYVFVQVLDTVEVDLEVDREDVSPWAQWGLLAASLLGIVIGVEGIVRGVLAAGDLLDVPDFVWGVTIVAAATSLPDLLVSIQAAQRGKGETALGNALGSNTFDLLVCVPAGVLIAGAVPIDLHLAVPLMGALTVGTIAVFTVLRTRLSLSRAESFGLLGLYVIFVAWMIVESVGWIDTLPG